MKICLSADSYPTPEHPFAAFISSIAEKFTEMGHQVTVIAPQSLTHALVRRRPLLPRHTSHEVAGGRIDVYRPVCLSAGNSRFTVRQNERAFRRCFRRLGGQFDIIYAHMWLSGYRALRCAVERSIPLFVATGEDIISVAEHLTDAEKERLNATVRGVVCVSGKNRDESIRLGLTDPAKCIVLPNGVDTAMFRPLDKSEARLRLGFGQEDFIVAFVGRFIHRKGARRIAQAIERLGDERIKAIFIGSTMNDEDASEEPRCAGILFKGVLPHEEIPAYLGAADIYALPTLAEGCSNSIVEALACGLPVVSSDRDFNYDILDERNAILIEPLEVDALADAIRVLRDNPQRLAQMSAAARASALALDYDTRVRRILKFIASRI